MHRVCRWWRSHCMTVRPTQTTFLISYFRLDLSWDQSSRHPVQSVRFKGVEKNEKSVWHTCVSLVSPWSYKRTRHLTRAQERAERAEREFLNALLANDVFTGLSAPNTSACPPSTVRRGLVQDVKVVEIWLRSFFVFLCVYIDFSLIMAVNTRCQPL